MADLSGYIAANILLDVSNISTPILKLTDVGAYPTGVPATITGIVNITQPDGATRLGNWATPDVIYSGGLQPASIALRLDVSSKLQQGVYTVTYIINASGYSPTTLVHTFNVAYARPVGSLTENFNLVTPVLQYVDGTNYNAGSFTNAISRSWSSVMCQGTLTGSSSVFDLAYGGNYYDSNYATSLAATVTYQSTAYTYLTIKDVITTSATKDIYNLPTQAVLLTGLTALKAKVDASTSAVQDELQEQYLNAFVLWRHANARICSGDFLGVDKYYTQMQQIFNANQSLVQTHSNLPLIPYVYTCDTGVSTVYVAPTVIEVIVGSSQATSYGLVAGQTGVTIAALANSNVDIISDGVNLPSINPADGGAYFTKGYGSGLITFSSPLVTGQYLRIKTQNISASPLVLECVIGSATATGFGINAGATTVTNVAFVNKNIQITYGGLDMPGINTGGLYYTKAFSSGTIVFSAPLINNQYIKIQTV